MIETTTLLEAARTLRASVNEAATALAVTIPTRQIVASGQIVHDCECTAVTVLTTSPLGLTNPTGASGGMDTGYCDPIWQATLDLAIVREANEMPDGPRGEVPPTPAMIEADLTSASADAAVLARAVEIASSRLAGMAYREGMVWGRPVVILTLNAPMGGLRAVTMSLQVNI